MRGALLAACAGAALIFVACGGGKHRAAPKRDPAPPVDVAPHGGLAIGLTEINPNFFWHGHDVGPFAPGRALAEALKPPLYRLTVDWSSLQPTADAPIQWAKHSDGCMRDLPPCRPYEGIRDTLRALRSEQLAGNGFAAMVVIYGVPDWAAIPASGCERADIGARSRPITEEGLQAYRRLVRSLQDLAQREGVAIRWWSPWNEPNGPFFISPQRVSCAGDSQALSPAVYARLARAMRAELRPGQELVVGELAGLENPRLYGTSISEFFGALPDDVVCGADVFAQHAYAKRGDQANDPGAVGELEQVLDRRPCTRGKPIWVTETGVGGPHVGDQRSADDASVRADCRALATALRRWRDDPRVDAAFQYTFRDDPMFPVGLVDDRFTKTWPAYDLWKAWGGGRTPSGPAPPLPQACAAG